MTDMFLRCLVHFKKPWICILLATFLPVIGDAQEEPQLSSSPQSETATGQTDRRAVLLDVQGPIGPATAAYLTGSLEKAAANEAELVIIRLDTPGGLDAAVANVQRRLG